MRYFFVFTIILATFFIAVPTYAAVCLIQGSECTDYATDAEAETAGVAGHAISSQGFSVRCAPCADSCAAWSGATAPCGAATGTTTTGTATTTTPPIPAPTIVGFGNPLCPSGQTCDLPNIIGNVIRAILGVVGSLALLMFVYAGIRYMLAAKSGKGDKSIAVAKNILVWTTLGLIVIFTSYIIVNFIIGTIGLG